MTDNNGPIVLFQGDSITDAGRNREVFDDLGHGYAAIAAGWYQALYPERRVTFLNRGISGDTAPGLRERWKEDCLDLKPDLVSILIGINDTARRLDSDGPPVEEFESAYRDILTRTSAAGAGIVLMEPFLLASYDDQRAWRTELDPRIQIVRALATEFNATLIPLDGIMAQAAVRRECSFWAPDGVHLSLPGNALVARAWLEAAEELI